MKKILSLLVIVLLGTIISCTKKPNEVTPAEESKGLMLSGNVIQVTNSDITSNLDDLQNGKIIVSNNKLLDSIQIGSILVNSSEQGFLVEVIGKDASGFVVVPASLDLLYKSGIVHFSNEDNASNQKSSSFNLNIEKELYNDATVKIDFSGNLNFNPKIEGGINFTDKTFFARMNESSLELSGQLKVSSTDGNLNVKFEKELFKGQSTRLIPGTLIWATFRYTLKDRITIAGKGQLNNGVTIGGESFTLKNSLKTTIAASVSYNNGWDKSFTIKDNTGGTDLGDSYQASIHVKHELIPTLEVLFLSNVGPTFTVSPYNNFRFDIIADNQNKINWHTITDFGIDGKIGVTEKIFKDYSLTYNHAILPAKIIYEAPDAVEIVSGNAQKAISGLPLALPLTVKVKDSYGNELAGVPVYFEIIKGSGNLSNIVAYTNLSGLASANVVVTSSESPAIQASIKSADSDFKIIQTTIFTTTSEEQGPTETYFASYSDWLTSPDVFNDNCREIRYLYKIENIRLAVNAVGENFLIKHVESQYVKYEAEKKEPCHLLYGQPDRPAYPIETVNCTSQNSVMSTNNTFTLATDCGIITGTINTKNNTINYDFEITNIGKISATLAKE